MSEARTEQLISRIIDGDVSDRTWREMEACATNTPEAWRELALGHRDHALVGRAVGAATMVADHVEAPVDRPRGHVTFNSWAGWAIAALVTIAWLTGIGPASRSLEPGARIENTAGLANAEDAFRQYLSLGQQEERVVRELPTRVLVESKPVTDGAGFEVIYIRQVMERTVVPELYHFGGNDEGGRPSLVRFQPKQRRSM